MVYSTDFVGVSKLQVAFQARAVWVDNPREVCPKVGVVSFGSCMKFEGEVD